jgi:hypothetical protein
VRRTLFVLMLGLCLFAAAGPLVEAADCAQVCADDQECSTDVCCSCCVHFRVAPPRAGGLVPSAVEGRPVVPGSQPARLAPDPREVLHVPKTVLL